MERLSALKEVERVLEAGGLVTFAMTAPIARDVFGAYTFEEAGQIRNALGGIDLAAAVKLQNDRMSADWIMKANQASQDRWHVHLERHASASRLPVGRNHVNGIGRPDQAYSLAIVRALIAIEEAKDNG